MKLCVSLLACLVGAAYASASTPVTEAWGKVFDGGQGIDDSVSARAVDSTGNVYVASSNLTDPFTNWQVFKFDPFGTLLWSETESFLGGAQINTMSVDNVGNVYVGGFAPNQKNVNEAITVKLTASGNEAWIRGYLNINQLDSGVMAIGFDASNQVYVACLTAAPSNGTDLSEVMYTPVGHQFYSKEVADIYPGSCVFNSSGEMLVSGGSNTSSAAVWRMLDQAGNTLFGQTLNDLSSGGTTSDYAYKTALDSAGDIFVGLTLTVTTQGQGSSESYVIQTWDKNDNLKWTSQAVAGSLRNIQAWDLGHVAALSTNLNTQTVAMYGSTGQQAWAKTFTKARTMALDGTNGVAVMFITGSAGKSGYQLQKYLASGAPDWLVSYGPLATGDISAAPFTIDKGTVHLVGAQSGGSTGTDILIKAYAEGIVPVSISLASNSNTGGGVIAGTVKLNSPAPAGGFSVRLKSLYPTALSVPATLTIPAGLSQANFSANVSAVDTQLVDSIYVTESSVSRGFVCTLNPSVLSGITLTSNSISGVGTVSGSITMSAKTGLAGRTILLKSSDTTAATVPSNVAIAPGTASASYKVTSKLVASAKAVTITATSNGVSKTTTLTVNP